MIPLPKEIICFDLETTGLRAQDGHDVTEIGMAYQNAQGEIETQGAVLLETEHVLEDIIIELTGITNELLDSEGRPPEFAYKKFCEMVSELKCPLVGHNILRFDLPFLKINIERLQEKDGIRDDWKDSIKPEYFEIEAGKNCFYDTQGMLGAWVAKKKRGMDLQYKDDCIEKFATGFIRSVKGGCRVLDATGGRDEKKNVEVQGYFDIEQRGAHRAMPDVLMTLDIYNTLREELPALYPGVFELVDSVEDALMPFAEVSS